MTLELAEETLAISNNFAAINLLDEHWFFDNILVSKRADQGTKVSDSQIDATPILQRTPTLPPRLWRSDSTEPSLDSCDPKLRHSLSSLDQYHSTSSSKNAREGPPAYIKLQRSERYLAIQHYIVKEAYYRKIFKEKKWRSLSDIECIEVQGFKDLGFAYDKDETLNTSHMRNEKMRPVKISVTPMFKCVDKRSADDMKDQLKFWARAVASNARQGC